MGTHKWRLPVLPGEQDRVSEFGIKKDAFTRSKRLSIRIAQYEIYSHSLYSAKQFTGKEVCNHVKRAVGREIHSERRPLMVISFPLWETSQ
jgi:hypothetical protein